MKDFQTAKLRKNCAAAAVMPAGSAERNIMEQLITQIEQYIPFNEQEAQDKEQILAFLRSGAELITRENPVAHFTATAWIVNRDRTKVLMVYHNLYNSWSWVGGHADGEEELFKVVQREIAEETGLTRLTPWE